MTSSFEQIRQRWLEEKRESGWSHPLVQLAFRSILVGKPLALAVGRQQLGLPAADLSSLVEGLVERGLMTLDERGEAVTGAIGLSLVPSQHLLVLGGQPRYVWCALDVVGIPAALGASARAESQSVDTGESVWVEIVGGRVVRSSHPHLRVSLPPPDAAQSLCGST